MNLRVRMTGAGCGIFNLDRRIVLGDLFAANAREQVLQIATGRGGKRAFIGNTDEQRQLTFFLAFRLIGKGRSS